MQSAFRQHSQLRVLTVGKKRKTDEKPIYSARIECIADLVNNKLQPICPLLSRVVESAIVFDLHKLRLLQRMCVCVCVRARRRGENGKFEAMGFPY